MEKDFTNKMSARSRCHKKITVDQRGTRTVSRIKWVKKTHFSSRRKKRKLARAARRVSRPMYR